MGWVKPSGVLPLQCLWCFGTCRAARGTMPTLSGEVWPRRAPFRLPTSAPSMVRGHKCPSPVFVSHVFSYAGVQVRYILQCTKPSMSPDEAAQFVEDNLTALTTKVNKHGVILFRGFPLSTAAHLNKFVCGFKGAVHIAFLLSLSTDLHLSGSVSLHWTSVCRCGSLQRMLVVSLWDASCSVLLGPGFIAVCDHVLPLDLCL